jgi:hypothetical protein
MTALYQNKRKRYETIIKSWSKGVIENKDWQLDLHIDEIDKAIPKSKWVEFALFIFQISLHQVDTNNFDVFLGMQLTYTKHSTSIEQLTIDYVSKKQYMTPPSIFLSPKNDKLHIEMFECSDPVPVLSEQVKFPTFYRDEKEQGEYTRFIFVTSHSFAKSVSKNKFDG